MISHSIAFLVLRKNLYVMFCHNNGLLTKYMVKVQSWKMASNLVRLAANPCRMEESARWLSLSSTSLQPSPALRRPVCSKLLLGSLFWNTFILDCVTGRKGVDGEWTL